MNPRRTPSSNQVFRLPGGTEDNDLWVRRDHHEDGSPLIRSTWELSDQEREEITAGANVELIVWGAGTPPVALRTTDEPLGRKR
jgi:hypothetical protein